MRHFSKLFQPQKTVKGWKAVFVAMVLVTAIMLQNNIIQASGYALVILSQYSRTLKIGQSFYLVGLASNGKRITWKSSKSSVASVNTYGCVTAKRAGTCKITGKVSGGEASCTVTVSKTSIKLSATSIALENKATATIRGTTSNGSPITWKSKKTSVAEITEKGKITAMKPGETTITASADGTTVSCKVKVKKPTIRLSRASASLYRGKQLQLTATTSSGRPVTWKSKKTSVATISDAGKVTAKKHGSALITAKLDGVTKECQITVKSPVITLNKTSVTIKKGKTFKLKASVSSGNSPTWKSSKTSVATVTQNGKVKAKKKGTCYIHVSEDGTKKSCHIRVKA